MSSPTEMHAEIVAALMWGPKLTGQLVEVTEFGSTAVNHWLEALHASGVIRISGEDEREGAGRRQRIWELQTHPFALEDWNPRQRVRESQPTPPPPESPADKGFDAPALCTAAAQPSAAPACPASAPASQPLPAAATP